MRLFYLLYKLCTITYCEFCLAMRIMTCPPTSHTRFPESICNLWEMRCYSFNAKMFSTYNFVYIQRLAI